MSEWTCSDVRERLPEFVTARAAEAGASIEAHVRRCADCAAEARLLENLLASRSEPPVGLAARILAAIHDDRGGAGSTPTPPAHGWRGMRRWSLAAAAVAVLALGVGVLRDDLPTGIDEGPLARVALDPIPEAWMEDAAVVAGAPVLDALSDSALVALLEEMQ